MKQRALLGLVSLLALIGAYALVSSRLSRPDLLPPAQDIAEAFTTLVGSGYQAPASEEHHHHMHSSAQMDTLVQEGVTIQAALGVTTLRVLFGVAAGLPLGILMGLLLGWS